MSGRSRPPPADLHRPSQQGAPTIMGSSSRRFATAASPSRHPLGGSQVAAGPPADDYFAGPS
eukprot:1092394-Prorocentrum_minimum.AAC.2